MLGLRFDGRWLVLLFRFVGLRWWAAQLSRFPALSCSASVPLPTPSLFGHTHTHTLSLLSLSLFC